VSYPAKPLEERFWPKVNKTAPNGCWEWTACTNELGYGWIAAGTRQGRHLKAHRVSYALAFGEVPEGMSVLHRCDNPLCVKPSHLFLGTQADNMADMIRKGRKVTHAASHCPQGHPYEGENVYIDPAGKKHCRACNREAQRRYHARTTSKRPDAHGRLLREWRRL
jgi:hypothetical protein